MTPILFYCKFFYLFYILTTVPSPHLPLPIPSTLPHLCSEMGKPPMDTSKAWHINLR